MINPKSSSDFQGILLVDKPKGKTSFSLVASLRKILGVKKIGHAGTLDPFATGVMVMLIGREYTKLSDTFLTSDKQYLAKVHLGISTDTYDCEGQVTFESPVIPNLKEIEFALEKFQGEQEQIPPMFSAKKINGQKLYDLARKGKTVERKPSKITMKTILISYDYPYLVLDVTCSKGTYIRSIANDLGQLLNCGAHLAELQRTRSGKFTLAECANGTDIVTRNVEALKLSSQLLPA